MGGGGSFRLTLSTLNGREKGERERRKEGREGVSARYDRGGETRDGRDEGDIEGRRTMKNMLAGWLPSRTRDRKTEGKQMEVPKGGGRTRSF
jgi:hypothetical protein